MRQAGSPDVEQVRKYAALLDAERHDAPTLDDRALDLVLPYSPPAGRRSRERAVHAARR